MNYLGGIIDTGLKGYLSLEQSKAAAKLAAANARSNAQQFAENAKARKFEIMVIGSIALVGILAFSRKKA